MAKSVIDELVGELMALGLSQYEATIYVGLVRGGGEMTGYAVAKATRVPHAKVYENLNRLAERNYVVRLGDDPARYRAIAPKKLFESFQSEFQESIGHAKRLLQQVGGAAAAREYELVWTLSTQDEVLKCAADALLRAQKKVYLSGTHKMLDALADQITATCDRGVEVILMHFGAVKFQVRRGRVIRHSSTEGIVSWRHQAQHLALCADSTASVWAVAKDGRTWRGNAGDYAPIAWLVKAYIRHDIYLQRVFADMPDELHARYGPSLSDLVQASMPERELGLDELEEVEKAPSKKPARNIKLRHIL